MEKLHFSEDKTISSVSHSVYYHIKKRIKKTAFPKWECRSYIQRIVITLQ